MTQEEAELRKNLSIIAANVIMEAPEWFTDHNLSVKDVVDINISMMEHWKKSLNG